jgi:hypothetical protein
MGDTERRKLEKSGAFINDGFANIPVPIRTLSDDYHDTPEPQDSDRVPPREPESVITRAIHRLGGKHPHQD